jgi:hypothetical protein
MNRLNNIFLLFCLVICQPFAASAFEINGELKAGLRKVFSQLTEQTKTEEFGRLPQGIEIIEGPGFRGLKVIQGKMELRVHTWPEDHGLMDAFNKAKEGGMEIIAAVNGTFYSSRGILGQVVSDGKLPANVRQIPGKLSRCFIATFRAMEGRQFWYLGETSLQDNDLIRFSFKENAWFNVPEIYDGTIDNLVGGGGWILRGRKDIHMEAYDRQRFRFRREDQTSRKTVIAQDCDRNLYFVVFETGHNFHMVARTLAKEEVFSKVKDAFFVDGGSSSSIVLKGKYLVAPLYLVDKARFSCIQIFAAPSPW